MILFSRLLRSSLLVSGVLIASVAAMPAWGSHVRRGPTAGHHKAQRKATGGRSSHGASSNRPRAIDDARATEIQGALVKAGYLQNSSGHWDDASADAMRKMQADNGWQTKLIPDSRALIKLGLGGSSGAATAPTANLASPTE